VLEAVAVVAIVGSFVLIAWWKHRESQVVTNAVNSYEDVVRAQIELNNKLVEQVQRPWGNVPDAPPAGIDLVEQLDAEWLKSPSSVVDFDDDLATLDIDEQEG